MGIEEPKNQGEGSDIEREKERLGANLNELSEHVQELESSSPSRRDKVLSFIAKHDMFLPLTAIGMGSGIHDWANGGTYEDFLFKTGLGLLFGSVAEFAKYRSSKVSESKKEMDKNIES